jgi:hypothetical protein
VANVGYARVSTIDQDPALQLDALAAAGCVKVFEDRASGARTDRAGLRSALDYVREGDVRIVWNLDRLGRSLPHLIETVTSGLRGGPGGNWTGRGRRIGIHPLHIGIQRMTTTIDHTHPAGSAELRRVGERPQRFPDPEPADRGFRAR